MKIPASVSHLAAISVALSCAGIPVHASAQARVQLEEIVVVARKREESIQDVPLSVSAVSGKQIAQAHLGDSTKLAQFAPNVVFDTVEVGTPGGGAFSIRGVSYQDVEKTFDPTVLVMVDGVVRGSGTGQTMSLLDVERVEVLRGPQGTLFGKNAVGGIINITRRAPELDSVFGSVRGTFGNFERNDIEGYLNFGGAQTALKLTASRLDHDGYFDNPTRGEKEGDRTEENFGAAFLWQPTEAFSLKLSYDYKDISGSAFPVLNISDSPLDLLCGVFGECAPGQGEALSGDIYTNLGARESELTYKEDFAVVEANWDLTDDILLTYLYGYLKGDDFIAFDSDGSPTNFFSVRRNGEYEQNSHELRFTGTGDIFNWQVGAYFWDAESSDLQVYEPSLAIPVEFPDAYSGTSESTSVFGETDVRFAERWVATAGFRWIEEEKTIQKTVVGGAGDRTDDDVIWRAGLRYEASDRLMGYLTYATGFRSGGFSARATSLDVLQSGQGPESLKNYEAGFKSDWFDGRLRVNGAVFHMKYEDMQIETNIPCASCGSGGQETAVLNAGAASIDGVELEVSALLTDNWTVTGNLGLLDTEYDEFFSDLLGTGTPSDFSSLPLRRAPETTFAVQSTYDVPLQSGNLSFRIGYHRTSDYAGTINDHPGTHMDSFGLLDASITYDHGDQWMLALFGNNLTEEEHFSHTFVVGPTPAGGSLWKFANPNIPRTYGLKLTYNFGNQ